MAIANESARQMPVEFTQGEEEQTHSACKVVARKCY